MSYMVNNYINLAATNLINGKDAIMQCFGESMEPTIMSGGYITFRRFENYEEGDIIFCLIPDVGIVDAHRIVKKVVYDKFIYYLVKGDNAPCPDGWVDHENVFGKMIEVNYKYPISELT